MNNRELKFRVWDKLRKTFIYPSTGYQGHFVIDLNGKFHNLQNGSGGEEYEVQQYIGIKDKNGIDIYEGDVVKYKVWLGCYDADEYDERISSILFIDGRFYPIPLYDECEDSWYSYKQYDFEVMGNVLENPELLT